MPPPPARPGLSAPFIDPPGSMQRLARGTRAEVQILKLFPRFSMGKFKNGLTAKDGQSGRHPGATGAPRRWLAEARPSAGPTPSPALRLLPPYIYPPGSMQRLARGARVEVQVLKLFPRFTMGKFKNGLTAKSGTPTAPGRPPRRTLRSKGWVRTLQPGNRAAYPAVWELRCIPPPPDPSLRTLRSKEWVRTLQPGTRAAYPAVREPRCVPCGSKRTLQSGSALRTPHHPTLPCVPCGPKGGCVPCSGKKKTEPDRKPATAQSRGRHLDLPTPRPNHTLPLPIVPVRANNAHATI